MICPQRDGDNGAARRRAVPPYRYRAGPQYNQAVHFAVLLLAACTFAYGNVPLSGNSPLGHRSIAPLAYQGIGQANSFTASELRACVCDEGRRSRSTGKERDAETGLDFMEARYFSGAQGRFTSPDEPFADQNDADPQSWNLYSYVRNNSLRFIDPSGRDCVNLDNGTQGDDGKGTVCTGAQLGTGGNLTVGVGRDEANFIMLQGIGKGLSSPHQIATIVSEAGQGAMLFSGFASLPSMARGFIRLIRGPKLIQLGLKGAAEAANAAAVDVANLSNKIVRQMAMRGWTSAQEIVETIQKGQAYYAVNKATGGAATEWVNQATGKFVVVDDTTNQVIQVSRPGMLPNHLLP